LGEQAATAVQPVEAERQVWPAAASDLKDPPEELAAKRDSALAAAALF